MSEQQLQTALQKILHGSPLSSLRHEELSALQQAAGLHSQEEAAEEEPRPFWSFIRESAYTWKPALDFLEMEIDLNEELNPILNDASQETITGNTDLGRLSLKVTRSSLLKSLRRHIQSDTDSVKKAAICVSGLAGFQEMIPGIQAIIKRSQLKSELFWEKTVCCALFALIMLEAEDIERLIRDYQDVPEEPIQKAAALYFLSHPEAASDEQLQGILGMDLNEELLIAYPDLLVRAAERGLDIRETITSLMDWASPDVSMHGPAKALLAMQDEDVLEDLFAQEQDAFLAEVALQSIPLEAAWVLPIFKERVDDDSLNDEARACLIAAIAWLEKPAQSWLSQWTASDSWVVQVGSIFGAHLCGATDHILEPFLKTGDSDVYNAARFVLGLRQGASTAELEALLHDLGGLSPNNIMLGLAALCLDKEDQPTPPTMKTFLFCSGRLPHPETTEHFQAHPEHLQRICSPPVLENLGEMIQYRAVHCAGTSAREAFRTLFEEALLSGNSLLPHTAIALDLMHLGGPQTLLGAMKCQLLKEQLPLCLDPDTGAETALAVLALTEEEDLAHQAIRNLHRLGRRCEPVLLSLLNRCSDEETQEIILQTVDELDPPLSEPLAALKRLRSPETGDPESLGSYERFLTSPIASVRFRLAELLGNVTRDAEQALSLLLVLLHDRDSSDVSGAALKSLVSLAGERDWVHKLVVQQSRHASWEIRQYAAAVMNAGANAQFISRLVEMQSTDEDHDVRKTALETLTSLSVQHPELGLICLSASDPDKVKASYRMDTDTRFSLDEDENKAEALKVMLQALDQRKAPDFAEAQSGKKLLLERLSPESRLQPSDRFLSVQDWEKLAVYLSVIYSDEETGSIVTEVGGEPNGEVLNALFQDTTEVVFRLSWC